MKILKLRFKNLNSLYGDWLIDFTDAAYENSGIFAITGPTGAGKSTVLDALCLALYGTTPRLGKISSSSNELMSRQTGECYAEVTFSCASGSYICRWSQHRARRNSSGNLMESKHELAEAQTGKILAEKKREVAEEVEKRTAMSYDRFTRSILLAQGGFDTFLRALPVDRAPILEQITGTELYSDISIAVHERRKDEQNRLELLNRELASFSLPNEEQTAELKRELETAVSEEQRLREAVSRLRQEHEQLMRTAQLSSEVKRLETELEEAEAALSAAEPERRRLDEALKAAELDSISSVLKTLVELQEDELEQLKAGESELRRLTAERDAAVRMLEEAEQAAEEQERTGKERAALISGIRLLDRQTEQKLNECRKARQNLEQAEGELQKRREEQTGLDRKREKLLQEAAEDAAYCSSHEEDAALKAALSGLVGRLDSLASAASVRAASEEVLEGLQEQLNRAQAETQRMVQAKEKAAAARQESGEAHARLLAEHRRLLGGRPLRELRREQLELLDRQAQLSRIRSLDEERKQLREGTPCPLCGSLTHPYAAGAVPDLDGELARMEELKALESRADKLDEQISAMKEQEERDRGALAEAQRALDQAEYSRREAETALAARRELADTARNGWEKQLSELNAALKPYGIVCGGKKGTAAVRAELEARADAYETALRAVRDKEQEVSELAVAAGRLEGVLEGLREEVSRSRRQLYEHEKEHEELVRRRSASFGDLDPDSEERKIDEALQEAGERIRNARVRSDARIRETVELEVRNRGLSEQTEGRRKQILTRQQQLEEAARRLGFQNAEEAEHAGISPQERSQLKLRLEGLSEKVRDLQLLLGDRRLQLERERALTPVQRSLEEAAAGLADGEAELSRCGNTVGALRQRAEDYRRAGEKSAAKREEVEAQRLQVRKWDRLHLLIGSADGRKYRNFAQGLTFELMITHANRQLQQMTDRYLLIRDEEQPLELNVIDDYQAGEIRSTRNLSGGESFMVSLALALGLSRMASRNVRVDSLFLDEGFGTLDEQSLETALETLAGLHEEQKLIGVISHIPALRERIPVQIAVVPGPGGRSVLVGPGCSRCG